MYPIHVHPDQPYKHQIKNFSRLDVTYQSQEDFRSCRDILRCSNNFYRRKRYDGVLLRTRDVKFGRLEGLFRCTLPNGVTRDVALVRALRESNWRPSSPWSGCRVVEEANSMFISPQYIIRGVLLVDTDLVNLPATQYYVDDVVDHDIFLRLGN